MQLPNLPGIYQIINLETGVCYIGQSKNIADRCYQHRHSLRKNKHRNRYLQRAWNKYSSNTFEFRLLTICSLDTFELQLAEQYWLDFFSANGEVYNLYPVVGSPLGKRLTPEHKAKIAQSLRGKKHSLERRLSISQGHIGIPQSQESRLKQSLTIRSKGQTSGSARTRFKKVED